MGKRSKGSLVDFVATHRRVVNPARLADVVAPAVDDRPRCKECGRVIKPKKRFINGLPTWQQFCTDRPCRSRWHNKERRRLAELGVKADRERQAREG